MAAFGSRTLHQERLSAALCRYPSTSGCEPGSPPHLLALPVLRHALLYGSSSLSLGRPQASKVGERMVPREEVCAKRALESTTQREGSGFSASRSGGEGVGRAGRHAASSVDRDMREVAGRKHGHTSRGVSDEKDADAAHSSGFSSLSSGDGWSERKFRKSKASVTVDAGTREKNKKTRVTSVREEGKEETSKNAKVNSAKVGLRVGLDMCSKRGDFMGAISLFDSAVGEGVELDQYHYNVLLYLCASAAAGVVLPAKSGNNYSSSGASFKDASISELSDVVDIVQLNGNKSKLGASNGLLSGATKRSLAKASSDPTGSSCDTRGSDLRGNLVHNRNGSCKTKTTSELPAGTVAEREIGNGPIPYLQNTAAVGDGSANETTGYRNRDECGTQVTEDMRKYALTRGFEIYEKMCLEEIPLSEAALTSVGRMAMSMGDGDMAFEIVKKIKGMGLTLRSRSYGPALFTYCNNGNLEKAFEVERHMIDSGVYPEEPELQALLKVSIEAGRGEKVYYIMQKLRTSVRQVSLKTAELIEAWFKSSSASRVGKRKWDPKLIEKAFKNGGGGWHGLGWLGQGKWNVVHAHVDANGICENCGNKLITIDLDPIETENFARSIASVAGKRERGSSFQKFQKWLDYYGPFEAVVDAANVGLFSQNLFSLTKVNRVINGIRQKLPSKKWPLIIVHNRRVYGGKMNDPTNIKLVEKWKNADAIYTTPTGSNDDWYWLYAAIKCKSLIVTNDEMRDHIFQMLGKDFFSKWKERHQVHFSFRDGSPEFLMPPPCSIVIQESEKGHWHIPISVECESDKRRIWLCITRAGALRETSPEVKTGNPGTDSPVSSQIKPLKGRNLNAQYLTPKIFRNLRRRLHTGRLKDHTIVLDLETAEKLCGSVIDFQI